MDCDLRTATVEPGLLPLFRAPLTWSLSAPRWSVQPQSEIVVKNNTSQPQDAQNEELFKALLAIRSDLVSATAKSQRSLSMIHSNYRDSARNLLHYLTFRRHDHRGLQIRLA